ncbi:angiopoietin-2-like [Rhinatrema bivittatum]|uniref:angiopoietin-2-like n=1 Tax=Rhinatrema bivittatum TaxID=194408 RepID=UPI00112CF82A|nr:angiopoietin-2-like [Rhinatrema bivittatum]
MPTLPELVALGCCMMSLASSGLGSHLKGMDQPERHHHQVQHGPCSYTFLLPEIQNCPPSADFQVTNSLQRDVPPPVEAAWPSKKLQQLENIMDNNTQWLQKLESYIQDNVKIEMAEIQRNAVQNQTAAMLEIGTSLLTQTAEQTRKLTNVETQVINQTSRLEIQLLEHSLSTKKLEKQLLVQTQEINKLHEKNSFLEKKVLHLEGKHEEELQGIKAEKLQMQDLVSKQTEIIGELEEQLKTATLNNSLLQKQQSLLMETVAQLLSLVSQYNQISVVTKEEQVTFKDCAEVYKSGATTSGIYTLQFPNSTETVRAFCDMETSGGGWTIIQHRRDGSVDFHRTWKDYKTGFGSPSGEHWLGNEFIHKLTSHALYTLRIQLRDWESNEAYSHYEQFSLGSEGHNYRLHLHGYSGTAGRTSSFSPTGTDFSTKDVDNDRCSCRCAQMATGGWWFDACGPSNLNGIYYSGGLSTAKYNGIKWHYWKGPSHGLQAVSMMIRPADF